VRRSIKRNKPKRNSRTTTGKEKAVREAQNWVQNLISMENTAGRLGGSVVKRLSHPGAPLQVIFKTGGKRSILGCGKINTGTGKHCVRTLLSFKLIKGISKRRLL